MNELEKTIMYPFILISFIILMYVGLKRPDKFWGCGIMLNVINVLLFVAFRVV